jgi:hypothetical protein
VKGKVSWEARRKPTLSARIEDWDLLREALKERERERERERGEERERV